MKKFPGEIVKKRGRSHKITLTDEQREWLVRWFPVTENARLAKAAGIGESSLREIARGMGLVKSKEGMSAIRLRSSRRAAKTNEKNGCYDRKRGHPVSEATMAGVQRRYEEERMGLRESVMKRYAREHPEIYHTWLEKRSAKRKEAFRKEKMRMMYGLERKTRLNVVLCPYKRSQRDHRYNALRRGYILSEECSEESPERYTIFYDDETNRSSRFEENCVNDGFKVEQWPY